MGFVLSQSLIPRNLKPVLFRSQNKISQYQKSKNKILLTTIGSARIDCTTKRPHVLWLNSNFHAQVRSKWLRILETSGGRSGGFTGASEPAPQAGASGQQNSARGRGRGGGNQSFGNRPGPNSRGGASGGPNRGGSRVNPRVNTPPASVS